MIGWRLDLRYFHVEKAVVGQVAIAYHCHYRPYYAECVHLVHPHTWSPSLEHLIDGDVLEGWIRNKGGGLSGLNFGATTAPK